MAYAEGQYHGIALPMHAREIELIPYDHDREPGALCWYHQDCNCKSKAIHNSFFISVSDDIRRGDQLQ
jgi:hypothetical protein